jgi:hypothetical protein
MQASELMADIHGQYEWSITGTMIVKNIQCLPIQVGDVRITGRCCRVSGAILKGMSFIRLLYGISTSLLPSSATSIRGHG